ncbi:zinc ribbon domain-containing protein [Denitrobacterium detoxificans]|jgi:hypothetical protein|uniref:zinc ribbon domain-containing protein n=1 Tax=Denitrobacterium detoxificans TaxID=79604 RepID=UPI0026EDEB20|nr:hypothetical protein [Denitrobacterium detoxificans]MBE6465198.1 hypothetical protein [Denitrobacterium detoxificans]
MQATAEQIQALESLQDIDRRRLRARMEVESLPHGKKIAEIRRKRAQADAKRAQVEAILAKAEEQMNRYSEEDEQLEGKQRETQAKINEVQGDYRSVTSLTRDLDGMRKRRETLEFEMGKLDKKIEEIRTVAEQAGKVVATLSSQETKLTEQFRTETARLQNEIAQADSERAAQVKLVYEPLLSTYEAALERCGGVAIAKLDDTRCSACRNVIEANRLLQIKREAPISQCPHCRRLLLID